jgi:hypothetical protein
LPDAIASLEGNLFQRQAQAQTLQRLSIDYLLEEIGTVIEGRGLKTLADYQATLQNRKDDCPQQTATASHLALTPTLLPTLG